MITKNHKITISIIISISIICLSILYIIGINSYDDNHQDYGQEGIIDLKEWDANKTIALKGEWVFYPNLLLSPEDDFSQYEDIKKYVQVPSSWKSYLNEEGSVDGSGTYRLRIQLAEEGEYGFKARTIRTASRIFANGNEIINVGNTSTVRSNHVTDSKYKIAFSQSLNKEIDLIINVSNFDNFTGGIISPIEFGTDELILKEDRINRLIDGTTIISSIVLGLYFMFTYFQRGDDKELFYFGLTSILIGLYLSTLDEQLLNIIIEYRWATRIQIQLLVLSLVAICLTRFSDYFFKGNSSKRNTNIITGIGLLNVGLIVAATGRITLIGIVIFQISSWGIILLSFINITYLFFKNFISKLHSIEYILILISLLFSFSISMGIKILFDMDLGILFSILMPIFLIVTSMLINNKLQLDYRNVQSLSKRLIRDDKLKDEFLARVSHELNTPLHIILNSTQSLIEGKSGTLNSKQQEILYFINQEGKRMTNLVSDLLNASQMKRRETQIRLSPFKAYTIVENILREMEALIAEDKNISLINSITDDFPIINGDPEKFTQIIYNLVNNSINHTELGTIEVSAFLKNGQAYFEVKDSGIGIKEEEKNDIFEVFYKNDNNSHKTGMGLGLPITKHLVEIQGGEIGVESNYGEGTSLTFTLPIYEGDLAEDEVEVPAIEAIESYEARIKIKEHKIASPTILIVDDRLSNRKVLADILYDSDYNISLANDGKEAIEALEKEKVDLIVLDYMLPDMSGDEVSKRIREKYSLVELPILMLTASGRAIDMENSFHCGANDFLRKPANAEELLSRIKSLLSMKESVEDGLKKEFQYFYSQISPHFLYNTINTIIGLSYKDTEKARKALTNLAIYFRGKLEMYKEKVLISLESEIELVRAYLEIEEMRYGDRLKVEIDIDEEVDMDSMIPPLTIQPLVENSVHHGIMAKGQGTIKISVKKDENLIMINLEDNGVGMTEEKQKKLLSGTSDRLGFKNVMEKIKMIKGAQLQLYSKEMKGTTITIKVPEVKKYASNISG